MRQQPNKKALYKWLVKNVLKKRCLASTVLNLNRKYMCERVYRDKKEEISSCT